MKLLLGFFRYKSEKNGIKLVCDWHDFVKYHVSKLFFVVIGLGLIVKHHVMHVFLVCHWVHHKELGGYLL